MRRWWYSMKQFLFNFETFLGQKIQPRSNSAQGYRLTRIIKCFNFENLSELGYFSTVLTESLVSPFSTITASFSSVPTSKSCNLIKSYIPLITHWHHSRIIPSIIQIVIKKFRFTFIHFKAASRAWCIKISRSRMS